jgi:hypothetical protein
LGAPFALRDVSTGAAFTLKWSRSAVFPRTCVRRTCRGGAVVCTHRASRSLCGVHTQGVAFTQ